MQTTTMRVNDNFQERVVIRPQDRAWVDSPVAGVARQYLDRIGNEVARATSLVRYAIGTQFTEHYHGGGEEYLVLNGEFADENGVYPAGTYVRNPINSSHAPFSTSGCELFVKLHQFDPSDTEHVVINTRQAMWQPGIADGLSVMPLHSAGIEHIALVRWAPGTKFSLHRHWGGEEIFVLEGVFEDEYGEYPAGSWIRSPSGSTHAPFSRQGCVIWVKTGHLGA